MTPFIRTLLIINGILVPILVIILLYSLAKETFTKSKKEEQGVLIGDKMESAYRDSIALQGVTLGNPEPLHNSTNLYLLVSALTYEQAKEISDGISGAGDYGIALTQTMNVLFINENYQVITRLLDRKAYISDINFGRRDYDLKTDTTLKHISYLIGYKDDNDDGILNREDHQNVFISDRAGQSLKQITFDVDVEDFEFLDHNTKMLIKYTDRDPSIRKEHKKVRFAIYDISQDMFQPLASINAQLDSLDKMLTIP